MSKTLYDIIDSWTMKWDRASVEMILNQVSAPFYKRKLVFFLLEEIWDILEIVDNPMEYVTEPRAIKLVENLLSSEQNELAAKFIEVEVKESPSLTLTVLNAEETMRKHPEWFEPWEDLKLGDI